jgi:hypothetical protein
VSKITNDTFVVAWTETETEDILNTTDIIAQLFWNNGSSIADQFQVNTFTTNNNNQQWPSILAFEDISYFVISWTSYNYGQSQNNISNIYAQLFDSFSFAFIGDEFRVTNFTEGIQQNIGQHALALVTGNAFVVAWTSTGRGSESDGVYAQRFVLNIDNYSRSSFSFSSRSLISASSTFKQKCQK